MTITIIGAGMMGSALVFPAMENGNEVRLVGSPLDGEIIASCREMGRHPKLERDFPRGVTYFTIDEMESALIGVDFVIGGVSSFGVDWFGDAVLPRIPENAPILSVTKGLFCTEDGALLTYPELWEERLAEKGLSRTICAIGGPCTSYELVAGDLTRVSFCGKDKAALAMMQSAMATETYHVSITTDVRGIESAVALKNGYALAVAMTIGVNQARFGVNSPLHYNSQAAVFGLACREMQKLLRLLGAGDEDEALMVGVGDLYVTVYGGRTRAIGILLGRGIPLDEAVASLGGVTLESLVVARRVAKALRIRAARGEVDLDEFPVLMETAGVLGE